MATELPVNVDFHSHDYAQKALTGAHQQYCKANPISREKHQKSFAHLPGGNTRSVLHSEPFPLTFSSGEGSTLTDVDGHTYTDFLGEFSAGIYGHSHPRILQAVQEAMGRGWNYGGHCVYEKTLARNVVERFEPSGIELVRFTNSGTESNTSAVGAAIAITGRKKILVFSNGYHGGTLVFPIGLMQGELVCAMNLPHEFVYAPYNNIKETREVVNSLPPSSLAAILVEPIQGSGGCRPATVEFLQYLRGCADAQGALLICDEVMASRLAFSGYSSALGIKADILTLGKYVGGGMTFGAFGGKRAIMELFDPTKSRLFHPGTYNNNVITMAAGIEGLSVYNAKEVERLNELGKNLKTELQQIFISYGLYPKSFPGPQGDILEVDSLRGKCLAYCEGHDGFFQLPPMFVTGRGSMINVRFSGPDSSIWQALFYHHMLSRNINIAVRGYTPLHLVLTKEEITLYIAETEAFVNLHKYILNSLV